MLADATITEVPIQFGERTSGTSKMSLKVMVEAFCLVAITAVQRLTPR